MSLIHKPYLLSEVQEAFGFESTIYGRVAVYASAYVGGLLALNHGHRSVVGFASLWNLALTSSTLRGEPRSIEIERKIIDSLIAYYGTDSEEILTVEDDTISISDLLVLLDCVNSEGHEVTKWFRDRKGRKGCKIMQLIYGVTILGFPLCFSKVQETLSERQDIINKMPSCFSTYGDKIDRAMSTIPTNSEVLFDTVWDIMALEFCGQDAPKLTQGNPYNTPKDRMARRARCGVAHEAITLKKDACNAISLEVIYEEFTKQLGGNTNTERFLEALRMSMEYVEREIGNYVPMTFMHRDGYEAFTDDGKVTGFWELCKDDRVGVSWHSKFSDCPKSGRAITDKRLYGEYGDFITYGVIVHKGDMSRIDTISDMYGEYAITWNNKILEYSSLTLNDSGHAPFVLPFTLDNMKKVLLPIALQSFLGNNDRGFTSVVTDNLFGTVGTPEFIEFQCHDLLQTSLVIDAVNITYK
tara:strand:+ start:385 stop:1791 length:1407 start_codon:yes stop_codon:yes gene_type:complete